MTQAMCVADLQRVYQQYKKLSVPLYKANGGGMGPIYRLFGTWNKAMVAAGIPLYQPMNVQESRPCNNCNRVFRQTVTRRLLCYHCWARDCAEGWEYVGAADGGSVSELLNQGGACNG